MCPLKWSTSNAVFVPKIDDEHKEIFQAVFDVQRALTSSGPSTELSKLTQHLGSSIDGHFTHEERLMRAARYDLLRWHKRSHDGARKRVVQLLGGIEQGDAKAGRELVEYLTSYLHDHTALADRMMGAFLRNQRRSMWKVTFEAGTRPMDYYTWVTANGEEFEPQARKRRF
jgi:hemerythrin